MNDFCLFLTKKKFCKAVFDEMKCLRSTRLKSISQTWLYRIIFVEIKVIVIVFCDVCDFTGLFSWAHGVYSKWNQWNHEPLTTYTGDNLFLVPLLLSMLIVLKWQLQLFILKREHKRIYFVFMQWKSMGLSVLLSTKYLVFDASID